MKTRCFQFPEYGAPTEVLQLSEQELPDPGPGRVDIRGVGACREVGLYDQAALDELGEAQHVGKLVPLT